MMASSTTAPSPIATASPPPARSSTEPARSSLSHDAGPSAATGSTPHSLSHAVHARKAEYVRPHRIRVKIGTWNVAACPGTDKDLASWFVEGKGIDKRLAGLDLSNNPAVDTNPDPPLDAQSDPNAVRLVGGDKIGLYILGLQEIIDLNLARTALFTDTAPMEKWKAALSDALPDGYELIAAEQLSGILMLVYASSEVARSIDNVSSAAVGTGLLGYMGNKGGVATRLRLGETTRMVFINSHLASGSETSHLDRRCWDYSQVLSRTQFAPINNAGVLEDEAEKIGDEDFAFWVGDLNFRLDGIPGDDIRHILGLHTRGEYDVNKPTNGTLEEGEGVFINASDSEDEEEVQDVPAEQEESDTTTSTSTNEAVMTPDETSDSLPDPEDFPQPDDEGDFQPDPSQDPASLQATIDSLLPHDQLKRMMKERKAFHEGWREGPITFLPTYKYDIGTVGLFDSSEKRRAPSWCDRILFRTRREKEEYESKIREEEEARKKDEDMKARGMDKANEDDEVLFDYDPEGDRESSCRAASVFDYDEQEDGDEAYEEETEEVVTKEGFHDHIHLDIYTSHQRITSSDHKPVISIFTLDYDGVVPELKSKVHAEVAWELDRAENEGQPGVTIIVDGQASSTDDGVDFGDVGYLRKVTRTLTIANTSRVPAAFSFVEKPTTEEDSEECPPWLTTGFSRPDGLGLADEAVDLGKEVTLEPGDTLSAVLDVHVTSPSQLLALNSGAVKLEDVLVLRVTSGRDYFIPIRGNWLPTCFGRSIDELIRLPGSGGIREFAKQNLEIATSAIPYSLDVYTSHPRELFRLIEAIESLVDRVVADENMLEGCVIPRSKPGWPFDPSTWTCQEGDPAGSTAAQVDLVDSLDRGGEGLLEVFSPEMPSPWRLELVCSVLRLFLLSLADGIITPSLWARIETNLPLLTAPNRSPTETEDDKAAILDILASAPNHNISFVFLAATLGKVVSELAPISKDTAQAFSLQRKAGTSSFGTRRSLSFRRTSIVAPQEVVRRMAMEEAVARTVGRWVCRCGVRLEGMAVRERRVVEEKMAKVIEVFFMRV